MQATIQNVRRSETWYSQSKAKDQDRWGRKYGKGIYVSAALVHGEQLQHQKMCSPHLMASLPIVKVELLFSPPHQASTPGGVVGGERLYIPIDHGKSKRVLLNIDAMKNLPCETSILCWERQLSHSRLKQWRAWRLLRIHYQEFGRPSSADWNCSLMNHSPPKPQAFHKAFKNNLESWSYKYHLCINW